ncbi:MAG TPA: type II secretion system protein [Armatimonadota bacterium]|jgi:type II secretory pathway pseudopilin PulG|nr:type II secretion system protein [Armatimonadota bacterium]HOM83088.1 type II secretion system protein [Armatimonadota bacterium]HOQ27198.1 type II secretion system protein [Armatimonadota bacterium]HPT98726.1 type II secretion system protein [Armatimonadota bacterium]
MKRYGRSWMPGGPFRPKVPAAIRQRCRGLSLVEMLVAALVLSFLVASTAAVYQGGEKQQRTARAYSLAQTDIRRALQRITRTARHGYQVVPTSNWGTFAGQSSGMHQLIVEVPEPGATSRAQVRFYIQDGNVYAQRQNVPSPGILLIEGVQALEFRYYQTDPGTGARPEVPPDQATEVEITLTAVRGPAVTTVKAYVNLRNAIGASL